MPAVERWIAAATACVVAAGLGAVAATRDDVQRPVAQAAPVPASSTPTPAATHATRHKPKPKPSPVKTATLYAIPAPAAYPTGCPPRPRPPGPPFHPPTPAIATADLPAPVGVPRNRHVDLHAVSGKGMWLTTWPDSRLDVAKVVAQAKAAGLRQLWI